MYMLVYHVGSTWFAASFLYLFRAAPQIVSGGTIGLSKVKCTLASRPTHQGYYLYLQLRSATRVRICPDLRLQ